MRSITNFPDDHEGATTVQYALIAGVLSTAVLVSAFLLRGEIVTLYQAVGEQVGPALIGF